MSREIPSPALALVLALSLVPAAFAAEGGASKFTDVPADAWYFEELDYAVAKGYISGTSDTTFSPSDSLTRSQFVTILGRMLGVNTADYTGSRFDDVDPDSWYGPYVAWAADKGYVNGIGPKEFAPDDNLTFEQMGIIMANYISKSGVVLTPSAAFGGYADAESISTWAQDSMEVMAEYDLLPVDEASNVRPGDAVIRSEAAVALVRLAKGDGKGGKTISDGTSEAVEQTPDGEESFYETELAAAQKIHDELWASGEITSSMTEKEKAIVYFDWMCMNCRYGTGESSGFKEAYSHTAYGSLINGIAMCDGLSYGYLLLLQTEGIQCVIIPDFYRNHAYNEAVLDGETYTIDLAGAVAYSKAPDGSYSPRSGEMWRDKNFMDRQDWLDKYYGPSTGG